MKKLFALTLSVLMILSLAACSGGKDEPSTSSPAASGGASPAASDEKSPAPAASNEASPAASEGTSSGGDGSLKGKFMGIVMPNATHGFTAESVQHAQAEAKALAEKYGFEYHVVTANESSEQTSGIETILGMNPDVIVLWPLTGDELRSAAQQVKDAGVPLIIYDRLIDNFEPTTWLMGDNDTIGEEAGNYFNEFFKDDLAAGEVSILEFTGDSSTVPVQRSNGFKKTADGKFKVVQSFETGWQRQTAMEQMEQFLTSGSKEEIESIKGIFTHDDEIVLGLLDAIKGYDGDAKLDIRLISGVSAGKDFCEKIDNTGIEGLEIFTYTFSPHMVRESIQKGVEILEGKTLEDHYIIETEVVDKNNVKEYMESEHYKTRYSI